MLCSLSMLKTASRGPTGSLLVLLQKGQASPQPTPRKIDPNEMLEVPTADGFAMMRAGDVADTTAEEFHDIRRVCTFPPQHCETC